MYFNEGYIAKTHAGFKALMSLDVSLQTKIKYICTYPLLLTKILITYSAYQKSEKSVSIITTIIQKFLPEHEDIIRKIASSRKPNPEGIALVQSELNKDQTNILVSNMWPEEFALLQKTNPELFNQFDGFFLGSASHGTQKDQKYWDELKKQYNPDLLITSSPITATRSGLPAIILNFKK